MQDLHRLPRLPRCLKIPDTTDFHMQLNVWTINATKSTGPFDACRQFIGLIIQLHFYCWPLVYLTFSLSEVIRKAVRFKQRKRVT